MIPEIFMLKNVALFEHAQLPINWNKFNNSSLVKERPVRTASFTEHMENKIPAEEIECFKRFIILYYGADTSDQECGFMNLLGRSVLKMLSEKKWTSLDSAKLIDEMNNFKNTLSKHGVHIDNMSTVMAKQSAITRLLSKYGLNTKKVNGGKSGYYYIVTARSFIYMENLINEANSILSPSELISYAKTIIDTETEKSNNRQGKKSKVKRQKEKRPEAINSTSFLGNLGIKHGLPKGWPIIYTENFINPSNISVKNGIWYEFIRYPSALSIYERFRPNITYNNLLGRIRAGWSIRDSINKENLRNIYKQYSKNGNGYSIFEVAYYCKMSPATIRYKLRIGYSIDDILEDRVISDNEVVEYRGVKYNGIIDLSNQLGLRSDLVFSRITRGQSLDEAVSKVTLRGRYSLDTLLDKDVNDEIISLYLVKININNVWFHKVGITKLGLDDRYYGYTYEVVTEKKMSKKAAMSLELFIIEDYEIYGFVPDFEFPGKTECFKLPNTALNEIKDLILSIN